MKYKTNRLIILLFCFGIAVTKSFNINIDADTLFHIKTGEAIIQQGGLLTTDPFSILGGQHMNLHEWLSEIILYLIYSMLGFWGVQLLCVISAVLTFYFVLNYVTKHCNTTTSLPLVLFVIILMGTANFFNGRPQIFSLPIFVYVLISLLEYIDTQNIKRIIPVPFLAVLYANLHGGASVQLIVLVIIVIGLEFISHLYNKINHKESFFCYKGLFLIPFTFLGTLINPKGFGVYEYALKIMGNKYTQYIQEWTPLPLGNDITSLLYFLILFGPLIICIITRSGMRFSKLGLCMFYAFSALTTRRMFFQTSLIIFICYYPVIEQVIINFWAKYIHKALPAVIIGALLVTGSIKVFNYANNQDALFEQYPVEAVEFLKSQKIDYDKNHLYNDYGDGGYLIFQDVKVFIDGRQDPYMAEFGNNNIYQTLCETLYLKHGDTNIEEFLGQYDFKYLLTDTESKIGVYAADHPGDWQLIFSDEKHSLYKKIDHSNEFTNSKGESI